MPVYLLQLLIIYLLSPEKGDFLKAFVFDWSVSATGKPGPLGPQNQHPVLGTLHWECPGPESGSSVLGRVTQSQTPVPDLLS